MTPDQLIEQAKLAIKWAESVKAGTPIEIECRANGSETWANNRHPFWNFDKYEYREKPRLLEGYVVLRNSDTMFTKDEAETYAARFGGVVRYMREVVE